MRVSSAYVLTLTGFALFGLASLSAADGAGEHWAYRVPVRTPPPAVTNQLWIRSPIDRFILSRLEAEAITPSPEATRSTLIRRLSLDLTGVIPTPRTIRKLLGSSRADRRERVVDQLLESPGYAAHWSIFWGDLLRERVNIEGAQYNQFRRWIHQSLTDNLPYDQFVREMISGDGPVNESNGGLNFILRDCANPEMLTVATTQIFLGTHMKCAQCHDHPFDVWEQRDFMGMAGFWRGTSMVATHQDSYTDARGREQKITYYGIAGGQGGGGRFLTDATSSSGSGRHALAELICSDKNPYFARVAVNRLWAKLMGRGLVHPVDDFKLNNPASHPQLLDWLAIELINSDYDLKHILRLIATSNTYQLSSRDKPRYLAGIPLTSLNHKQLEAINTHYQDSIASTEASKQFSLFEAMPLRRMNAEQLYDSLLRTTGLYKLPEEVPLLGNRYTFYRVRRDLPPYPPSLLVPAPHGGFMRVFDAHSREVIYHRKNEATIPQVLELLNGKFIHAILDHNDHPVRQWLGQDWPKGKILEELYLATLTRPPTSREQKMIHRFLGTGNSFKKWVDVHWAIINSREFMFIQ